MPLPLVEQRLLAAPERPGVYLMKDPRGTVLYVGKASVLRDRLRSYFGSSSNLPNKIRRMLGHLHDFEYIVTDSEAEALILENTLIKRYRPRYNARLKDDKTYPYLKIDLSEEFPRVYMTVVGDLPAEGMTELLDRQSSPEATVGGINVVSAAVGHMSDETIANFVANSVIAQGGATRRLAEAFSALVPDIDSRRQLLSLAEHRVSESPVGTEEDFPDVWRRTEEMLTSYRDEQYVGAEYARELSGTKAQAADVERVSDDPPERVRGWLATVSDDAVRQLDLKLLQDLLQVEYDPASW